MPLTITIEQVFEEFKSELELKDTFADAVTTHQSAVQEWMRSLPGVESKLIGSLQRKTRIQPRPQKDTFDIDILIILGTFHRWVSSGGVTPAGALDRVEGMISDNEVYDRMGPETDSPTIRFQYADGINVEVVPAYRDGIGAASDGSLVLPAGRGYWIPKKNNWVIADYDFDADYISRKNKESDGYLIPVIKMLKAAKRNLFSDMESYHLEVLAANLIPPAVTYFKEKRTVINHQWLVWAFFQLAKDSVLNPAKIPGSKSPSASAYMDQEKKQGMAETFKTLADYLAMVYGRPEEADIFRNLKRVFGEPFPVY